MANVFFLKFKHDLLTKYTDSNGVYSTGYSKMGSTLGTINGHVCARFTVFTKFIYTNFKNDF